MQIFITQEKKIPVLCIKAEVFLFSSF